MDHERLRSVRAQIQPVFDAMCRALADMGLPRTKPEMRAGEVKTTAGSDEPDRLRRGRPPKSEVVGIAAKQERRKTGPKPKVVIAFPEPKWTDWVDLPTFGQSLAMHMRRHGDSVKHLCKAVSDDEFTLDTHALRQWTSERSSPHSVQSLLILHRIERRYRLPKDYFRTRLPHQSRAARGNVLDGIEPAMRRRLAWHLPDDFMRRNEADQEEIVQWVMTNVVTGTTDYRRYQAAATKQRYGLRFKSIRNGRISASVRSPASVEDDVSEELEMATIVAPGELEQEMMDLIRFKTSTLTAFGFQRSGVWNEETADQKVEHFGLLFGALIAKPESPVRGFGMSRKALTFAILAVPAVWDWYLQWREQRRGFFTAWESDMLNIAQSLLREETGWLRQMPHLARRLRPVPGLISAESVERARSDWPAFCDEGFKHARLREKEIVRVARIHRDPFEPILPILEADSPVGEYRRITDEILRLMPDEERYPRAAAEAVRSFLLLRLGLHLGLRQKNLRQLLVCPRDKVPTSERHLEDRRCGELRWSVRDNGWEVLIPSIAFKNSTSSFFGAKPFRLLLPDLGGLYGMIEAWISRHRAVLLGPAADPGTFFVKTAKRSSVSAAYEQTTFYEAWRLTIQRYGIYNPYTGRGAVKGLLPHGPHNVRDVIATHILKQTGSYEQASYAIQDTPEMVSQHYGRFLPQDKVALAAQILNRVWEAA
ncbi:hypothetical protein ATDW_25940 [Asticcacaulis sp. DW145]|uniref:hypothetical protein n=1 Tax=Asticcacaulis sp. DW145 TaxID=3095608 RepID=UPI00308B41F2|nr:hypothetical protein ATDW_25940 [Asticcacaulis sp. DW145]